MLATLIQWRIKKGSFWKPLRGYKYKSNSSLWYHPKIYNLFLISYGDISNVYTCDIPRVWCFVWRWHQGFQAVLGCHFASEDFLGLSPPYLCLTYLLGDAIFSLRVTSAVIILFKGFYPHFQLVLRRLVPIGFPASQHGIFWIFRNMSLPVWPF